MRAPDLRDDPRPAHPHACDGDASAAPRLVLASASPRRRHLLAEAGLSFDVLPSAVEERSDPGEPPEAMVERLAREKALDVAARLPAHPARPVLGADTIVVASDDRVLGKPRDEAHAARLLGRLVGRRHRVMTAIAVAWTDAGTGPVASVRVGGSAEARPDRDHPTALSRVVSRVVTSEVTMRAAEPDEIRAYVALGESLDKAGGYALQGEGSRFVTAVAGSRTNVIGLPVEETLDLLERAGWTARAAAAETPR